MSNLLKANYVICKTDKKRIIDSNNLVAKKIEERNDAVNCVHNESDESLVNDDSEFLNGIKADTVELLLEEDSNSENLSLETAEELLKNARQEAERIIEQAREEAAIIKEQGFQQGKKSGYEAGYNEGTGKLNIMKQDLVDKEKSLEYEYHRELEKLEPVMVDIILDVIETVLPIYISDKKDIILHLVQSAIEKIDNSREFIVRVSKEDAYYVKEKKELIISKANRATSIEIIEDISLSKNQCMIETDGGIYDCSLDTQLTELINDIKALSCM